MKKFLVFLRRLVATKVLTDQMWGSLYYDPGAVPGDGHVSTCP